MAESIGFSDRFWRYMGAIAVGAAAVGVGGVAVNRPGEELAQVEAAVNKTHPPIADADLREARKILPGFLGDVPAGWIRDFYQVELTRPDDPRQLLEAYDLIVADRNRRLRRIELLRDMTGEAGYRSSVAIMTMLAGVIVGASSWLGSLYAIKPVSAKQS